LILRPARPGDAPRLRRWDEAPHVVASDPNDDWGWETELARFPDWREQLIAELNGRPVGFVQIIDPAARTAAIGAMCRKICAQSISGSARRRISAGVMARA
jgi:aminoglycoside 6'-N-acetyltransferase